MIFEELDIKGAFLIHAEPFEDERGVFRRNFCEKEFEDHGIISKVSQANISENKYRHTLRGFHYQVQPYDEGKTMTVLKGRIYDIIVDLRKESKTFLKCVTLDLLPGNRVSFHVPPGCANAFLTMEDDTLVHYYCSYPFTPDTLRAHFNLLAQNNIISFDLEEKMNAMVGFRNIAVHEYQNIDNEILKSILQNNLRDIEDYYKTILTKFE